MPPRTDSLDERSHRAKPAPGGPGAAGPDHTELPDNDHLAGALEEMADLLAAQHANPFRTAAYRDAAGVLRALDRPAADILAAEGAPGLTRLPKVGQSLARTIEHLVAAGTTPLLEHL